MLSDEGMRSVKQLDNMQKLMHVFTHDLRNPLLNINALVQETGNLIQGIKEAHSSGQQQTLNNILNTELPDILDMLKNSANRMDDMVLGANDISHCMFDELECETIDMHQMFLRCFALLKLGDEGFELHYEGDKHMVFADPLVVQRIVSELLTNAKKAVFASQDSCAKVINIGVDAIDNFIYLQVEDSGCGFKESELLNVFTPFFSGSAFKHGTGMGLTRVKAWVEHHGGSVSAETSNNKTKVVFSLPKA